MALSPPAPRPPGVWLRAGRRHSTQGPWQGSAAVAPCRPPPPPPHRHHLLLPPPARNFTALRAAARRRTPVRRRLFRAAILRGNVGRGGGASRPSAAMLRRSLPPPPPPSFKPLPVGRERSIAEEDSPQEGRSAPPLHSTLVVVSAAVPAASAWHL